jgi:type III secretion protein J
MNRTHARLAALLCASLLLTGCKETLFAKLSEPQANEVIAALAETRIAAAKERIDDTSWQVEVDAEQLGQALLLLRHRGVPSQPATSLGDVFKKDGMISSPLEERARYAFALQESIAATLRRIDGVVDARVHVAIPHQDPLASRVVPVSASVFVKYRPSVDMEMLAPNIKSMVMASVEGLDFRNVSLVAFPVEKDAAPEPPVKRTGFMTAQAATRGSESAPVEAAGIGPLGSVFAGLSASGLLGWWMRRRRRADGRPDSTPTGHAVPHGPLPAKAVVVGPSTRPGLFDSGDAARPR